MTQADIQRAEAKRCIRHLLGIQECESNGVAERLVDCIIGAALLEVVEIQRAAIMNKQDTC